ncbi:MAG: AAA family ATPase [Alphaproteobacteria bacterium]|nr:AAA family ATPase [Alphaproteobacteria bacterium]
MFASTLSIDGFKCFGKATLKLHYPGRYLGRDDRGMTDLRNINIVLGDNGGGKSSVLRALAIAMLAPALLESGFVPYRLVRRGKPADKPVTEAVLKVSAILDRRELRHGDIDETRLPRLPNKYRVELLARIETRPSARSQDRLHLDRTPDQPITKLLYDDYSPAFFVVGYGATRRVETGDYSESSARRSRGLRYQRVAGLFEDHVALRPLQAWLPRLRDKEPDRFQAAIKLIAKVLPANVTFDGQQDGDDGQFLFLFNGVPTPFSSLSDGYKSFIGWVGDLVANLNDVARGPFELDTVPGIVLVDEIDLHLHPAWQRLVIPSLAAAFPRLQFVFTTHSPLVASTVHHTNIFVTDTDAKGLATVRQYSEHVFGRGAEQLLLSSYFGLSTTRPEQFHDEAASIFKDAAGGDSEAALRFLDLIGAADKDPGKGNASS